MVTQRRTATLSPNHMGLDSVEIVILWEQSLGVSISNEDAATLFTPRMAIDFLATKLGARQHARGACLTLRAFSRLRRAISSAAGVPRNHIRPLARLRDLVPRVNRNSIWLKVQQESGVLSLPKLNWVPWLKLVPLTVGDLAYWVVAHTAHALKGPEEFWTRSEIRTVVRTVVTDVCGARDFSDDDHFVRDIGIC
jgi:hypothetical protein